MTGSLSRSIVGRSLALAAVGAILSMAALAQVSFPTADSPIAIPDNSAALTACQDVVVAGGPATITDVDVQLSVTHSWVGDLTVELTRDPEGTPTVLTLQNRAGRPAVGLSFGDNDDLVSTSPVLYDDEAAPPESAENMGDGTTTTNIVVCQGDGICDYIPFPDAGETPIAGQGTALSDFDATDSNVTWRLCVADGAAGDTGTLSSWTLILEGTTEADLQVTKASDAVSPVNPGDTVVYTVEVENLGPNNATNVVVTDMLPAEVTYDSDDCGGDNVPPWTWNLGSLAAMTTASCNITVTVNPGVTGDVTNTASASGDEDDPVPANDSNSTVFTVELLSLGLEIPTISDLGLLLLLLALAGAGLWFLRR